VAVVFIVASSARPNELEFHPRRARQPVREFPPEFFQNRKIGQSKNLNAKFESATQTDESIQSAFVATTYIRKLLMLGSKEKMGSE
jgi:hypothetical protein